MAAEPLTWQVVEYVRGLLMQVSVANGDQTDIGLHPIALTGEQVDESAELQTFVGFTSNSFDEARSGPTTTGGECELVIEVAIPLGDGADPAELLAHRVRADVVRALRKGARGGPKGLTNLRAVETRIGPPEGGSSTVMVQVTARAGLVETFQPA